MSSSFKFLFKRKIVTNFIGSGSYKCSDFMSEWFSYFLIGYMKSIWWMPRLKKAMKDAAWRRYASGRCLATFDPEISEWGNPPW